MSDQVHSWNDDRLDELSRRVDNGFKAVDQRFERVEREMKDGFAQVDQRFERVEREMKDGFARVDQRFEQVASREEMGEVKAQLDRLTERIDRLYYLLVVMMVGLFGALLAKGGFS